jgi:hypothetical protein
LAGVGEAHGFGEPQIRDDGDGGEDQIRPEEEDERGSDRAARAEWSSRRT